MAAKGRSTTRTVDVFVEITKGSRARHTVTFGQRPKTMILQEFIAWEDYVRCIAIGREHVLPLRYDLHAVVDHLAAETVAGVPDVVLD